MRSLPPFGKTLRRSPYPGEPLAAKEADIRQGAHTASGSLVQQYLADTSLRIVHHAACLVEDHRLASRRIAWRPCKSGLAWISAESKINPRRTHLLRKRLGFWCIAGPLLPALRVVKAEREFSRMPRATFAVEHRRLPGKPVLI